MLPVLVLATCLLMLSVDLLINPKTSATFCFHHLINFCYCPSFFSECRDLLFYYDFDLAKTIIKSLPPSVII